MHSISVPYLRPGFLPEGGSIEVLTSAIFTHIHASIMYCWGNSKMTSNMLIHIISNQCGFITPQPLGLVLLKAYGKA